MKINMVTPVVIQVIQEQENLDGNCNVLITIANTEHLMEVAIICVIHIGENHLFVTSDFCHLIIPMDFMLLDFLTMDTICQIPDFYPI